VIFNAILFFRHPLIVTYLKLLIDSIIGGILTENNINCRKWDDATRFGGGLLPLRNQFSLEQS
jgi:hypothetical protein